MVAVLEHKFEITIREIDGELVPTCNARDIHAYFEVGKIFGAWIQERIERWGFTEDRDYIVFAGWPEETVSSQLPKSPGGANRLRKEYAITLNMAKTLSLVQSPRGQRFNPKNHMAWLYFENLDIQHRSSKSTAHEKSSATITSITVTKRFIWSALKCWLRREPLSLDHSPQL